MTLLEEDLRITGTLVVERSAQYREFEALGDRIAEGAGHLAAATGAWLELVAEFDERGGWATMGARSCAHWLSWRCGLGMIAAREHVRVARALRELPLLRTELAAGHLSYSKVRAVTRVANPLNEAGLVNAARSSTGGQLERIVSGMKRAKRNADTHNRHASRSLAWRWDEDGSLVIRGRFAPEEGAVVLAALDAFHAEVAAQPVTMTAPAEDADAVPDDGKCAQVRTGPAVNADSMVALAQCALEHLHAVNPSAAPTHTVNVHVDLAELLAHADETEGTAHLENGPGVHPETLRRILCDSAAVIVAHRRAGKPGTSMDVGRRTRTVSPRLRRALVLRDGGCTAPGCNATKFLHAHHVIHWSRGGPTTLWNLVLLCSAHHHLVHEGGFTVEADGHGAFVFRTPDATAIPYVPKQPGGTAEAVADLHQATIGPWTATPRWYGERLDLHYAVDVLLLAEEHAARRFKKASAEASAPAGAELN